MNQQGDSCCKEEMRLEIALDYELCECLELRYGRAVARY